MISFATVVASLPAAGVGFVVGAFTPAIGRKIKAAYVKYTQKAESAVKTEAGKITKKL